jgi:hypothetical protein
MSAGAVLALVVWIPLTGLGAWFLIRGRRLYSWYPAGIPEGPVLRLFGLAYFAAGTFLCVEIARHGIEPDAVVALYIFGSIAVFTLARRARGNSLT